MALATFEQSIIGTTVHTHLTFNVGFN